MTEPSWTPEDVELLVSVVNDNRGRYSDIIAERVLAALAEAGRLAPAGAAEQWSVRVKRSGYVTPLPLSEESARDIAAGNHPTPVEVVRRWTTPWLPVDATDTPKEKP